MSDPVSFAAFGPVFMRTLLTQEIIAGKIRAAIPRKVYIKDRGFSGVAEYLGFASPPEMSHNDSEVTFRVGLKFKIAISWARGDLPEIAVTFPLVIAFETYETLMLFARIDVIPRASFQFDYHSHDVIDIAVVHAIESQFVTELNKTLCASASDRVIDIAAAILESTDEDSKDPDRAGQIPLRTDSQTFVPAGVVVSGEVPPGRSLRGLVLLRGGEAIRFLAYGQLAGSPALVGSFGANGQFSFGISGRRDRDSVGFSVQFDAWGECYARTVFPSDDASGPDGWFVAPETGRYEFRLTTDAGSSRIVAKIFQARRFRSKDCRPEILGHLRRVSFGEFGQALMQQGLSAEFLERKIASAIGQLRRDHKLDLKKTLPGLGQVALNITLNLSAPLKLIASPQPDTEMHWEAAIAISGKGKCDLAGIFDLKTSIKAVLVLTTTNDPSIEVSLGKIAIDDVALKFQNAVTQVIQRVLEKAGINSWLTGECNSLLKTAVGLLPSLVRVPIWQIPDAMLKTLPAHGDSHPFGADLATGGTLRPGETKDLVMHLNAKQTVSLTADFTPLKPPGYVGVNLFLAMCDDSLGMLDSNSLVIGPGKTRKQTLSLNFTTPEDGTYHARVRCHPAGGEDFQEVAYKLHVKDKKA